MDVVTRPWSQMDVVCGIRGDFPPGNWSCISTDSSGINELTYLCSSKGQSIGLVTANVDGECKLKKEVTNYVP